MCWTLESCQATVLVDLQDVVPVLLRREKAVTRFGGCVRDGGDVERRGGHLGAGWGGRPGHTDQVRLLGVNLLLGSLRLLEKIGVGFKW